MAALGAVAAAAAAGQAQAPSLPALLEPYAGYDVVFGPTGPRVLGPEAAPAVEWMVGKAATSLGDSGCVIGDIGLQAAAVTVHAQCGATAVSVVLDGGSEKIPKDTKVFSLAWSPNWPDAAKAELSRKIAQGEAAIRWQRVRPPPGSAADAVLAALLDAHAALAVGDRAKAVAALTLAKAAQPTAPWSAQSSFDFAVLAIEAGEPPLRQWAVAGLQQALAGKIGADAAAFSGPDRAQLQGLAAATAALGGDPTATAQQGLACQQKKDPCDVIAVVRALAAVRAFEWAAKVLDAGPLAPGAVASLDLLKLRFGLASAQGDAAAEIATAKRMDAQHPGAPDAADLLAAGLSRAGRWREAVEILHELSKAHPERDIVLGRIAGMINFLTDAAGIDPARKADLEAIEQRMRVAASDPKDVVARFIVATRAYYSGHLDLALEPLTALNQTTNRDPRLPLYLAMTHFWLGHQQQAQGLIQHAVDIGPSDPDVFYCRSQIVRGVNLPLAIKDLERYEQMTKQPWSVGPAQKAARVAAELAFMRKGLLPPLWDKPGPERAVFLPETQTGTAVSAAVRRGVNWLPGAETPTDIPPAATATGLAAPSTAATGQAPPVHEPQDDPAPWWPVAATSALVAALLARWWSGRNPPAT